MISPTLCAPLYLAGVIATNTTISRENLNTPGSQIAEIGMGGLSGLPLCERATVVIRHLREKLGKEAAIIGVGGIDLPQLAQEKLDAGADLAASVHRLRYELRVWCEDLKQFCSSGFSSRYVFQTKNLILHEQSINLSQGYSRFVLVALSVTSMTFAIRAAC